MTEASVAFASWQIRALHAGYALAITGTGVAQFAGPFSSGWAQVASIVAVLIGLIYLLRALRLKLVVGPEAVIVRNVLRTYNLSRQDVIGASSGGRTSVIPVPDPYQLADAACLSITLATRLTPIEVTATALMPIRERDRARSLLPRTGR